MHPQHIRLRTLPLIVLAGIMIAASLVAASPAAAAKAHPFAYVYCFTNGPNTTPGYALDCQTSVEASGSGPVPTGTLKLIAASYKGTLSTPTCSTLQFCGFQYTPKGRGSDSRLDTITAVYSGDANYYSARTSTKIHIYASPPLSLDVNCTDSVPTGTAASCVLLQSFRGPTQFDKVVTLRVPTYKGTLSLSQCASYSPFCTFSYTPKGRGYDARVDTITASYTGDLYNSPNKVTESVQVTAAP